MTNEELNAWERQPSVLNILTSKEFGEWLHRRDKNKEKHGEWIFIPIDDSRGRRTGDITDSGDHKTRCSRQPE